MNFKEKLTRLMTWWTESPSALVVVAAVAAIATIPGIVSGSTFLIVVGSFEVGLFLGLALARSLRNYYRSAVQNETKSILEMFRVQDEVINRLMIKHGEERKNLQEKLCETTNELRDAERRIIELEAELHS